MRRCKAGSRALMADVAHSPSEPLRLALRGGGKPPKKEEKRHSDLRITVNNLLAGAIAGGSVESALYPLDTIKTRLQALRGSVSAKEQLKALKGSGGVRGMYSGLAGNLAGVIPSSAIFFSVYQPVKEKLQAPGSGVPQWFAQLVAAASAGVTASSIRVPTEVVKSRMQMGQFPSPTVAIRSIIQKEGVRGLYAGFQSFLVRDIVFDVIEFVSYEQMKTYYMDKVGRPKLTAVEGSAIGAVAGALTATFTTPLDVIKTRMMLQGTNKVYSGVLNCTVKMIQEEGVAALFKGVGPRVTWISIGGAVFFGALERARDWLDSI